MSEHKYGEYVPITKENLEKLDNPRGFEKGDIVEINVHGKPQVGIVMVQMGSGFWNIMIEGPINYRANAYEPTKTGLNVFKIFEVLPDNIEQDGNQVKGFKVSAKEVMEVIKAGQIYFGKEKKNVDENHGQR